MTKNQSIVFRFLLFLAGAGIVVLAFFLTRGNRELTRIDAFVWTSIGICYLIFFLPFFFSMINISNFSGKVPVISLIWPGIILYIAASVVVMVMLTATGVILFNTAVIIQAILFFGFLVTVYFAYFASSHIGNVAAQEDRKKQFIKEIKPKAQVLSLTVNGLPAEYEKAKKTLNRAFDDIRYIYPVDNGIGDDLELQIITSLNTISELCSGINSGAHSAVLEQEADKLCMLIKERKLLRN
ncbi:MAG: hypothetical protein FWF29_00360 [Treponema sp.]|nr:hypothetical protein [Treponema sp.]